MKRLSTLVLLLSFSATAYSDGSPWLIADGTTNINLSLTSGSTEDFFIGDTSTNLGGTLEGTFAWLKVTYGYDDIWAFDARTGYATTDFETNQVVQVQEQGQDDLAETSFGVSYQFINEFEADNGFPTISGRIGYTIGGSYDPDVIEAIGDAASGFDLSLLVGKSLTPSWSVFGDLTFRQRDNDVADGIKYILGASYSSPIPNLGFLLSFAGTRTDSDLNLGDGITQINELSQTNRDSDLIIAGANYGFSNGIGLGLSYSSLINGNNIPDTDVISFNIGYSF